MTISDPDDKGKTAPIEQPKPTPPPLAEPEPPPAHASEPVVQVEPEPDRVLTPIAPYGVVDPVAATARAASPQEREVLFIPLAVNIGDGFKFGCGFFLALVVAVLVAFVLLAALFVLTSLFGLNLPITR